MTGNQMAVLWRAVAALALSMAAASAAGRAMPDLADTAAGRADRPITRPAALEAVDLGAWLDGLMPYALEHGDIAGAAVVVVKNGTVLLAKGYGVADVRTGRPIDPAATLFRQGSVSKLFTWTAVMQLQERGALDLDADVNRYLDFTIPAAFGRPITLRNLMTHTAGFEERLRDLFGQMSLEAYVKEHLPRRIDPPGETPAYSNYGACLAGYVVQRVSGEPYEEYVQRHILAPLGMSRSTFAEPLPAALAPGMSAGYVAAHGEVRPFEMTPLTPAGGLSATADDLGRFMLAYLRPSQAAGSILRPETIRRMETADNSPVRGVPGMALGFYRSDRHGRLIVGHAGDTEVFSTDLQLFPQEDVGLYVALNSRGRSGAGSITIRHALFQGFVNRYFPDAGAAPAAPRGGRAAAREVAGLYSVTRRAVSSFLSLADLANQVRVEARSDGTLSCGDLTDLGGHALVFRPIGPLLWQAPSGLRLGARRRPDGRYDLFASPAIFGYTPTPWFRASTWLTPALALSLAALLTSVIAWPSAALVRRRYGGAASLRGVKLKLDRLTRLFAVLALAAAASWVGMLNGVSSDITMLGGGRIDPWLRLNQILAALCVIGALVAVANAVTQPKRPLRPAGIGWDVIMAASFALLAYAVVLFRLAGPGVQF
jgi:CubicO group peptidase (beta-lactamase class C family)